MKIQVGASRLMGDGSGDASVSVSVDGGRKRQVRVVRGMDESWLLFAVTGTIPLEIRLIHQAAAKDCPPHWQRVDAPDVLREILTKGREVIDDPKLQRGVLKAIRKRKEHERRERVRNHCSYVQAAVRNMLSAGATHDEVMDAVNEALVQSVQAS